MLSLRDFLPLDATTCVATPGSGRRASVVTKAEHVFAIYVAGPSISPRVLAGTPMAGPNRADARLSSCSFGRDWTVAQRSGFDALSTWLQRSDTLSGDKQA